MKRVIDGRTYNTLTATTVASYSYEDRDGYDTEAVVYQTMGGAFFAVHTWEVPDPAGDRGVKAKAYFEALSREEVQKLVETEQMEIHNEEALTLPPEAEAEREAGATIYVRVPESLKARVDEAAKAANVSTNAWMLRCAEHCLSGRPA
jgi:predicted HicB family RNase H-like nuclease